MNRDTRRDLQKILSDLELFSDGMATRAIAADALQDISQGRKAIAAMRWGQAPGFLAQSFLVQFAPIGEGERNHLYLFLRKVLDTQNMDPKDREVIIKAMSELSGVPVEHMQPVLSEVATRIDLTEGDRTYDVTQDTFDMLNRLLDDLDSIDIGGGQTRTVFQVYSTIRQWLRGASNGFPLAKQCLRQSIEKNYQDNGAWEYSMRELTRGDHHTGRGKTGTENIALFERLRVLEEDEPYFQERLRTLPDRDMINAGWVMPLRAIEPVTQTRTGRKLFKVSRRYYNMVEGLHVSIAAMTELLEDEEFIETLTHEDLTQNGVPTKEQIEYSREKILKEVLRKVEDALMQFKDDIKDDGKKSIVSGLF